MRFKLPEWRYVAGVGAIPILFLLLLQTSYGRRLVFARVQRWVEEGSGIRIEGANFRYQYLPPKFDISEMTLRPRGAAESSPFVRAERVSVRLPVWKLIRGCVDAAQVRVTGLLIELVEDRSGRTNWPTAAIGSATPIRGPSIFASGVSLRIQNERSGLIVQLVNGQAWSHWAPDRPIVRRGWNDGARIQAG
jgi:hypothetical protein